MILTELLTISVLLNANHKRKNINCRITNVATWKVTKKVSLDVNCVILSQYNCQIAKQKRYMNLQIDIRDNLLWTHPIQTGLEMSIEPYPNWQYSSIDDPNDILGDGSVLTWNRTPSGGPEPLLTLNISHCGNLPLFNFIILAFIILCWWHVEHYGQ